MKTTLLTPNRLLLEFPTKKEMNLAMFRISEYSEGDKPLKHRAFTLDEFFANWTDENGEMLRFGADQQSYFAFWEGYNIPMNEARAFFFDFMGQLSKRELKIQKAIVDHEEKMGSHQYLIACVEGDQATLDHENAHGRFFEDKEYREAATRVVEKLTKESRAAYEKGLLAMKYVPEVFVDEIQAYICAFDAEEHEEMFPGVNMKEAMLAHRYLTSI